MVSLRQIDRYILRCALAPMGGTLAATMIVFLLERLLRSLDLLAQTERGFDFLLQLAINLTPHYAGLVLPAGFFIGLFVAINRLNNGSEIDALMAGGVSLGRIMAPLVALGLVFMLLSLALYGFAQPYARYGYRAVMHAARDSGWNGEVRPFAVLTPTPSLSLTADGSDQSGRVLTKVFIRRVGAGGSEDVFTAQYARLQREAGGTAVRLELVNGQQYRTSTSGRPQLLSFESLTVRLPLVAPARLLRSRGGQENELTLFELADQGFGATEPDLPRQVLLAELYSRLARAVSLPLMPLLALPFALTAKRAGASPGIAVAGLLIFALQTSLVFNQGLVAAGRLSALEAQGGPTAIFALACVTAFLLGRKRPGENPLSWIAERLGDLIQAALRRRRPADARAN
jgi:lipopolysaccharide export system permease protein